MRSPGLLPVEARCRDEVMGESLLGPLFASVTGGVCGCRLLRLTVAGTGGRGMCPRGELRAATRSGGGAGGVLSGPASGFTESLRGLHRIFEGAGQNGRREVNPESGQEVVAREGYGMSNEGRAHRGATEQASAGVGTRAWPGPAGWFPRYASLWERSRGPERCRVSVLIAAWRGGMTGRRPAACRVAGREGVPSRPCSRQILAPSGAPAERSGGARQVGWLRRAPPGAAPPEVVHQGVEHGDHHQGQQGGHG